MKMIVSLGGRIRKIGIAAELHEVMNDIYYMDIKRDPIVDVAEKFFKALRLYQKHPTPQLWTFLYGNNIKKRLTDAFSRKNEIDGENMQRALDSDKNLAGEYHHFNKVFQKLAEPPKEWLKPGTSEHKILLNHFKSERNLHNFKRNIKK